MPWKRTLIAAWVAQTVSLMGFALCMPFLPLFIEAELGIHDPRALRIWAGVIGWSTGFMLFLMHPVWGVLADRYGRKPMAVRSMFGGAVVLALLASATTVHQVLLLRFLQGALTGTMGASIAMVSGVIPRNRTGLSMGLLSAAVGIGWCVGAALGGVLADKFGYRVGFIAGSLLLFGAGVLVLFFVREATPAEPQRNRNDNPSLGTVLRIPGFPTVLALCFAANFGLSIIAPVLPLFVKELLHAETGAASHTGGVVFARAALIAIAAAAAGIVANRFGPKRILLPAFALCAIFLVPHGLVRSVWPLYLCHALLGLAYGGILPMLNSTVSHIVPRHLHGKAYGLTYSLVSLGFSHGPLVGGLVASRFGLRLPFFLAAATFAAAFTLTCLRFKNTPTNHHPYNPSPNSD